MAKEIDARVPLPAPGRFHCGPASDPAPTLSRGAGSEAGLLHLMRGPTIAAGLVRRTRIVLPAADGATIHHIGTCTMLRPC